MIVLPARDRPVRETTIVRACFVALNRLPDVRVSRNNTGRSPIPCQHCQPRLCKNCANRLRFPIVFGLGEGGPDLVGMFRIHWGASVLPIWFGVEVKTPAAAKRKDHPEVLLKQAAWRRAAAGWGVLAIQVTSSAEAVSAVEGFRAEYMRRLVAS